jgi:two-component system sensor histidine kinase/response regulator
MSKRPRILIVDDEPRNLSLLEALLSPFDAEIVRAGGGREGIAAFSEANGGFDLVLLDVMMPEVDGLTALAEMRRATPVDERVPILLVTALHAREDRIRALEAGADDFCSKPLDPHEVRCRVRTFLDLRATQRSLKERAQELERLQKAKAELTRMIVHDLKNPLAGVGSNLSWMVKRLGKLGVSDPDLLEALEDARGGATRLLSLIAGLIDVEKAETGQLVVKAHTTELQQLLDAIARRSSRAAADRSITIETAVPTGLEGELDPDVISRVVENLVENAIRYTNGGGRIVLSARSGADGCELAVCNTGTPIPEALRARVFDKHVSSESSVAGSRHLGLGLYFCRLAAQAHGGEVGVESTEEWPTRFWVRLPPSAPPERPVHAAPVRTSPAAFID